MSASPHAQANLEAFALALSQNGIKYSDLSDDGTSVIRVSYTLDNISDLVLFFFFDEDGGSMHLGSAALAHVPDARTEAVLRAVNQANVEYRWINFYVDKDNDIMASSDLILTPNTIGDTCKELLARAISIIDEAYPSFMKAIWA